MTTHLTILQPGPDHSCPPDAIIVELSPPEVHSLESARRFWKEAGESPDIVVGYIPLELPDEVAEYLNDLRASDGPEMLEQIINAAFNLGRAYQS